MIENFNEDPLHRNEQIETHIDNPPVEEDISTMHMESTTRETDTRIAPLLMADEINTFRNRWSSIQAQFVDSPQTTVEQGDALIAEVMERIKDNLSTQQAQLCEGWSSRNDLSTEDLRLTLQNYRTFLNRLLSL